MQGVSRPDPLSTRGTGALGNYSNQRGLASEQRDSRGPDDSLVLLLASKGCLIISLLVQKYE